MICKKRIIFSILLTVISLLSFASSAFADGIPIYQYDVNSGAKSSYLSINKNNPATFDFTRYDDYFTWCFKNVYTTPYLADGTSYDIAISMQNTYCRENGGETAPSLMIRGLNFNDAWVDIATIFPGPGWVTGTNYTFNMPNMPDNYKQISLAYGLGFYTSSVGTVNYQYNNITFKVCRIGADQNTVKQARDAANTAAVNATNAYNAANTAATNAANAKTSADTAATRAQTAVNQTWYSGTYGGSSESVGNIAGYIRMLQ
ncbi:MAG: hypothetical protein QHH13_10140 [Melioribacter sp.]|nr:hypothetical protein [Melioribacter sp.]